MHRQITTQELDSRSDLVPSSRIPYLLERFETFSKRAKRLKVEAPGIAVGETFRHVTKRGDRVSVTLYTEVAITGTRPRVAGCDPVANLVWAGPEAGNIVRARPGVEVPEQFRFRHECDHCGHKRSRKETWLFRDEAGEYIQVGRTCVQDFAGDTTLNPLHLAMWADAWAGIGEGDSQGGPAPIDLVDYLTYVAACVRLFGWVPRSRAEEWGKHATAGFARHVLTANPKVREQCGFTGVTQADYDFALAALDWLETADCSSDYMHNVYAAVKVGYVTEKTIGYVASLVGAAYPNALNREAERAKAAESAKSEAERLAGSKHIGKVGDRLQGLAVEVTFTRVFDGMYGPKTLVKFETSDGSLLQWWASGYQEDAWERGGKYTIKATVKRHETDKYLGVPVTTVARVTR